MGGMALQTEHRLAHGQQTAIHGAMRRVALGAVFHHRSVLISEWTLELRVALQAKLIDVVCPQILPGRAAMRIMAIGAGHFPFPNRVVIGQVRLRGLSAMAVRAFRVLFLEGSGLGLRRVDLVAVDAFDIVSTMRSQLPVLQFIIPCVAAQAYAVGLLRSLLAKIDDFFVARAGRMQTSVAMAVFAL